MMNIRVVFNIVVVVSLLASCYGDETDEPSSNSSNRKLSVETENSLFGSYTKIQYVRKENNEIIFTDGTKSIPDIIKEHNGNSAVTLHRFNDLFRELEEHLENYIITPEILVVVDYSLFKRFNENENAIISYLISYWNSVTTRFLTVEAPLYRIHITGIVIAQDRSVLSYLQYIDNDSQKNTSNMVSTINALDANGKWLYSVRDSIPLSNYDLAVTMTSKLLCMSIDDGECMRPVLGTTYPSKVCADDSAAQTTHKVAIVKNVGAFENINFAASQIGLLLGAKMVDDVVCSHEDGSLLSKDITTIRIPYWSNCSAENFQRLVNSSNGACLKLVKPFNPIGITTYLPGSVMHANEQCRKLGWKRACVTDQNSICTLLKCTDVEENDDSEGRCFLQNTEVADGTACGTDKLCFLSKCIDVSKLLKI